MPNDGRLRQYGDRHYKYSARHKKWLLQCRSCARYLTRIHFAIDASGPLPEKCKLCDMAKRIGKVGNVVRYSPKPEAPVLFLEKKSVSLILSRERESEVSWTKQCLANMRGLLCRTCGNERRSESYAHPAFPGEFYRECVSCRNSWTLVINTPDSALCPLDLAYKRLYPTLAEYGPKVTGTEVKMHPNLYPGTTYFHLTPDERGKAVEQAYKLVKERSKAA